jgi:four helix bundle suffix protein
MVANAMLVIIGRALNMLKSQIEAQGKAFEETGGFSERLMAKRLEARGKDQPPGPECPVCSKPMRQRKSAKGNFWGCSEFPDCKGTRPV